MKPAKRLLFSVGPIVIGIILVAYGMNSFLVLDWTKILLAVGIISIIYGALMLFYIDPNDYAKPNRKATKVVTLDGPSDPDLDGVNRNMVEIANSGLPADHQKVGGLGSRYFSGGDPRNNPPLNRK